MKLLITFSFCILIGIVGLPTVGTALELASETSDESYSALLCLPCHLNSPQGITKKLEKYSHVAKGGVVSIGRGLAITDDELEAARTEEFSIGFQLTPALRFSVPFSSYAVDTRGGNADVLPFGMLGVETAGMMLTLSGRGKWAPFIGLGTNFYSFTEQFDTPANIQNTFGVEASTGLKIKLIDSIFEVAQLHASFGYQFSFLRPKVSVPTSPDVEALSLNRHSISFRLELLGL